MVLPNTATDDAPLDFCPFLTAFPDCPPPRLCSFVRADGVARLASLVQPLSTIVGLLNGLSARNARRPQQMPAV